MKIDREKLIKAIEETAQAIHNKGGLVDSDTSFGLCVGSVSIQTKKEKIIIKWSGACGLIAVKETGELFWNGGDMEPGYDDVVRMKTIFEAVFSACQELGVVK